MRLANRARRQVPIEQLAVESLNLRSRTLAERSRAQSWTGIPCEQARVVAEGLGPQPRASTDVEPVIEVLADGLPGGADVATEVPLSEHAVEVSLRGVRASVNGFADVLAVPGLRIAADVEANHPHFRKRSGFIGVPLWRLWLGWPEDPLMVHAEEVSSGRRVWAPIFGAHLRGPAGRRVAASRTTCFWLVACGVLLRYA